MNLKLLPILLLLVPAFAMSQYRVTIILDNVPKNTTGDKIYAAGNWNGWNPADPEASLTKDANGKFTKVFDDVQPAEYEFKFTLGTWETVETNAAGRD